MFYSYFFGKCVFVLYEKNRNCYIFFINKLIIELFFGKIVKIFKMFKMDFLKDIVI